MSKDLPPKKNPIADYWAALSEKNKALLNADLSGDYSAVGRYNVRKPKIFTLGQSEITVELGSNILPSRIKSPISEVFPSKKNPNSITVIIPKNIEHPEKILEFLESLQKQETEEKLKNLPYFKVNQSKSETDEIHFRFLGPFLEKTREDKDKLTVPYDHEKLVHEDMNIMHSNLLKKLTKGLLEIGYKERVSFLEL